MPTNIQTKGELLEKLIKFEAHQSKKVDKWNLPVDTKLIKETINFLQTHVFVISEKGVKSLFPK